MSWSHGQNHVMKLAKLETSQLVWITLKTTDQQRHPPALRSPSSKVKRLWRSSSCSSGLMAFLVLSMTADPSGSEASKNWRHPNDQPSNPHMAMGPETLVPSGSGCAKKRLETNGHTAKSFAPGCQITQTSTHTVTYIHTVTYSYYDTWMCTTPTKKREVGCSEVPRSTWRMQLNVWCTLMCLEQLAGFAH